MSIAGYPGPAGSHSAAAALLLGGFALWPGVFIGAVVANILTGAPLLIAGEIGVGNTLEALLGAYALIHTNQYFANGKLNHLTTVNGSGTTLESHAVSYLDGNGVYVDGNVHTNTIEGFWSLCKNGIRGVYHSVSAEYLQDYLNEYSFRFNRRRDGADPIFWAILDRIEKRLAVG